MGSSGGSASREAERAEEERRRQIRETQGKIEAIFSSPERERGIQEFIGATRGTLQQRLNRDKADNDRKLKFALARSGQAGGSTGIDQNQNLSEAFLEATIEAERRAQGAGARLRDSDQESKLALFNQALGGLDLTTAASNANAALSTNIGLARGDNSLSNFDSFFGQFADLFKQSREAAGRREQQNEFGTLFGNRPTQSLRVAGAGRTGSPTFG
jgi:hypothetical protein